MNDLEEIEIDSRTENLIWRGIGRKSVRKMAEETGLSVERVAQIRTQLIEGVDEITLDMKRSKLLADLQEIADKAREGFDSADDTDSGSKMLTAWIGALKTILGEMRQIEKSNTGAIDALNQMRIRELMRLIDLTVAKTFAVLSERHGLEEDEMYEIFQGFLKPAAMELQE